jgi:hypothetical protein
MTRWDLVFDPHWGQRNGGASEHDLAQLYESLRRPVTLAEMNAVSPKTRLWRIPQPPLPTSYLDLLRFSNGGAFRVGDRYFDPLFTTTQVREFLLAYAIPEHLPGLLPVAFDGGGGFYLLDLRVPPAHGDCPVVFSHASILDPEDLVLVGETLVQACTDPRDPDDC